MDDNKILKATIDVLKQQKQQITDLAKSKSVTDKELATNKTTLEQINKAILTLTIKLQEIDENIKKTANAAPAAGIEGNLTIKLLEEFLRAKDYFKGSLDPVLQAIAKIELKPPAVNVAAPIINIPKEVDVKKPSWINGLIDLSPVTDKIQSLIDAITNKKEKEFEFPKDPTNPVAVRLSDGKKFIEQMTQAIQWAGGGAAIPRVSTASKIDSVPVVNPDGTNIGTGSGGGGAVTIADGADVAQGATTDASSANTVVGILKNIKAALAGALTITGSVTANAGTNLNTSALALDSNLTTTNTEIGATNETAASSDTATSGLNGRLQRIAQRLTSIIALLPTALGQGTMSTSFKTVLPSDQSALATWGHGATAASVPANATYQGLRGTTALPTAVTDGQQVGEMGDKYGRTIIIDQAPRDLVGTQNTTLSATTSETTIVTAAASIFNDLVCLLISNTSASTSTRVDIRDDTGGSIIASIQCPPNQVTGFIPKVPIPQTAVNKNWTAQCATSTTDIRVFAEFVKNK